MDVTKIIEFLISVGALAVTYFVLPAIMNFSNNSKVSTIVTVVDAIVRSARELDITNELIEMGTNKVEYAWSQAKAAMAARNITVSDDELKAYIKSAVTNLRIEIGKTTETLTPSIENTVTATCSQTETGTTTNINSTSGGM